jgi:hypothetical protein
MGAMNAIEILTADRDEWKKRAIQAEKASVRLTEVLEQAVELYEILRAECEAEGELQGENFWEGHRDTVMHALGKLQHAHAVVDAAIGAVPRIGEEKGNG